MEEKQVKDDALTVENLEPFAETQARQAPPQPNYYSPANNTPNIPEEYKPISMWGYFGYQLLFAIPCVGFILICVFAFGGARNINLRNYARSYFCGLLVGIILLVILFVLMMVFGVSMTELNN